MKGLRMWVPLLLFAGFCGLAAYQLTQPKDEFIESTMIGEPVPDFNLRPAIETRPGVALADLKDGRPKLLNIWASWCVPCIAEAPQLEALQRQGVPIVGIAIRDKPEDVARFLANYGNPYTRIGADDLSEVQLSIGSSGVPETFVVNGDGVITYQHIGDIRAEHVPLLLQELAEAGA
ncbi:DsbE family thiol:disulfide interchange protein [Pontixanthobacter luteolus]|uniref:DsbE family thiol:disulfide interchange protein n=1 Tax=Pontixanthobacter luteolus TaxID=295089 RepID=UPI00230260E2|nr:DsbE family thiol:disulfide interchange protein [Pontixanthobacter luteolus]